MEIILKIEFDENEIINLLKKLENKNTIIYNQSFTSAIKNENIARAIEKMKKNNPLAFVENEIKEGIKNGLKVSEMAKTYKVSPAAIYKFLRKENIHPSLTRTSTKEISLMKHKVIELLNSGKNLKEIANKLKISCNAVRNLCLRNKIDYKKILMNSRIIRMKLHQTEQFNKLIGKEQEIVELLRKNVPILSIAKMFNVTRFIMESFIDRKIIQ